MHTGCVSFFLEDLSEAGVDVAVGPPAELIIGFLLVFVPGPPATALCCSASCSPGSNDIGSADTPPG